MSAISGPTPETMDPVDAEYFHWNPEGAPFSVHMQLDAIDGIARDVIEGVKMLPRYGLEVGGLLLGTDDPSDLSGQFYGRDAQPMGGVFRFRGHRLGGSLGAGPDLVPAVDESGSVPEAEDVHEPDDHAEQTESVGAVAEQEEPD